MGTCDRCARRIVSGQWHPATLGDDGEIYEFCSAECRRRFDGDPQANGR